MDLEGHYPIKEVGDGAGPRRSTENPGPSRVGVFGDFEKPIEQQWYYHAVAQVVLAHSLIRSFPEVNVDKIGITGISWGGTLTSTVMGVDNRFKFVIPVHGQLRICPGGAKRLFSGVRPLPGHLENKEVDVILPWYITSHDRQRLPSSNSWWLLRSSQF
jgi:hypothetical protein